LDNGRYEEILPGFGLEKTDGIGQIRKERKKIEKARMIRHNNTGLIRDYTFLFYRQKVKETQRSEEANNVTV